MTEEATSKIASVTLVEQLYLLFAPENSANLEGRQDQSKAPCPAASRSDVSFEFLDRYAYEVGTHAGLIGLKYSSHFLLLWLVKSIFCCAVQWRVLSGNSKFTSVNLPVKMTRTPILLNSAGVIRLFGVLMDFPHRASANAIHLMILPDLRHSLAIFLSLIGINLRDLRDILGHYKPETLALVRNNSFENKVRA